MPITRRVFLCNSALAVVGTAALPAFLTRAANASVESGSRNKRLVVIFQRGAADGLNIVVPHGEQSYYAMRPSIIFRATQSSISMAFSGYIPRSRRFSRCGSRVIWQSCTLLARPIPHARILMRRILWSPVRQA